MTRRRDAATLFTPTVTRSTSLIPQGTPIRHLRQLRPPLIKDPEIRFETAAGAPTSCSSRSPANASSTASCTVSNQRTWRAPPRSSCHPPGNRRYQPLESPPNPGHSTLPPGRKFPQELTRARVGRTAAASFVAASASACSLPRPCARSGNRSSADNASCHRSSTLVHRKKPKLPRRLINSR